MNIGEPVREWEIEEKPLPEPVEPEPVEEPVSVPEEPKREPVLVPIRRAEP